jgi:hemophore-related protein
MGQMNRVVRRGLIVAAGISAAAAVSVSAAQASPAEHLDKAPKPTTLCTAGQIAAARADSAPKVSAYLQAHPDVDQELTTLRADSKDQRRDDAKAYVAAHPDVGAALKDARSAEHALRQQCRIR